MNPVNVFRKLWQAIEHVAVSMSCLAVTLDAITQELSQHSGVAVDVGPLLADEQAEALPPLPVERNGEPEPVATRSERKRRS